MICADIKIAEVRERRSRGACALCGLLSPGGLLHAQPCPSNDVEPVAQVEEPIKTFAEFVRLEESAGRF